jgi:hypothetical protein
MKLDFNEKCNYVFKQYLGKSKIYGEYGCGASTVYAINNFKGKIISVETDQIWAEKVRTHISSGISESVSLNWIDVGPVKEWGYPKTFDKKENFVSYQKEIWKTESPDFILIDGRFRVACFLQSIMNCKVGSNIIIDDYYDRSYYHCVEQIIEKKEIYGDRMALFTKENEIDIDKVNRMYEEYKFELR